MTSSKLPCGSAAVWAILAGKKSVNLVADKEVQTLLGLAKPSTVFLEIEEGTDPRPLYFVPFDPDCNQSLEEKEYGRRVLFERIHSEVLGAAGRVIPPVTIPLSENLLGTAIMGMYAIWENGDSKRHLRKPARQLLHKLADVVSQKERNVFAYTHALGWELRIKDGKSQEIVCDLLSKFSCETMDLRPEPQPDLFDETL